MTHEALNKAKTDLYNIVANHALNDYLQANFKNGKRIKRPYGVKCYSLGYETEEAQKYYKMVFGKTAEEITEEQENDIKAFLLPYRTVRTEFLQDETIRSQRRSML